MKRILAPALVALCLLFIPAKEQSFAEQATPPLDLKALQWQPLRLPNATKTDLGGDLPEVVILTLTNDEFEKIHASPEAALTYLNSLQIFKKTLLKVIFSDVTPSKGGKFWILIIPHTGKSTGCIVAWQVP